MTMGQVGAVSSVGAAMTDVPATYGMVIAKDVMVPMRDGIRLATDIYYPAMDGQIVPGVHPTVLQRTPYDKTRARFLVMAEYYATRGYVFVHQDCRGRNRSEGSYYHIDNEATDGHDAIEWIAAQPWSNGKIGTIGTSYGSIDQLAAATQNPPHLTTMIPQMGGHNLYQYGWRHFGCANLKMVTVGFWMAASSQEATKNPAIRRAIESASMSEWLRRLPLREGASPLALLPDYERWVLEYFTRADFDEFWENPSLNMSAHYDKLADVPILFVGGWYDSWTWAMLMMYTELVRMKRGPIKIVMGPWIHGDVEALALTYSGDVDFGQAGPVNGNLAADHEDFRRRWYDRWLRGIENGVEDEPPVRIFVMGGGSSRKTAQGRLDHGGKWRDEYEWPLARTRFTPFYLLADGSMSPERPVENVPPLHYRHDPEDPVPTIASNVSGISETLPVPPGYAEMPVMMRQRNLILQGGGHQAEHAGGFGCKPPYRRLADRPDVLVFRTPVLSEDVEVTGPLAAHLWISSSAPDTDFAAMLLDIYPPSVDYPEGYHLNLSEGIVRARYRDGSGKPSLLRPGQVYEVTVELEPTSNVFQAGHRIQLHIASSNFPKYDVNPGTGEPVGQNTHTVVAENSLYVDADHPSHLTVPIIPAD